jgi:hypothetical protein
MTILVRSLLYLVWGEDLHTNKTIPLLFLQKDESLHLVFYIAHAENYLKEEINAALCFIFVKFSSYITVRIDLGCLIQILN